jgi:hypothetical protein
VQQILNVITPSTTQDLVSLADMKQKLFIDTTDTTKDFLLQEIITNTSETIAKLCNRVFGYEAVDETFYQLNDGRSQRLYLSRWPVQLADIQTFTQDGSDLLASEGAEWVLEQDTGTLYRFQQLGPWLAQSAIDVTYSGGYELPDSAPGSLKFVTEALIREGYMSWIRSPSSFGVRQISHKEARIGYYGPNMFPTLGLPATWDQVKSILSKYIRHWV